jgi:uncharacterized protein (TIGR04255 family)
MAVSSFHLAHAPIVEAIVDLDCDMPANPDWDALEQTALSKFSGYPKSRRAFVHELEMSSQGGVATRFSNETTLGALRFFQEDERQLVQIRTAGYSFNRLAPYSSLDAYLPEVERTWRAFVELVAPVSVRSIRLRCINRLLLPFPEGKLELDEYLNVGPRVPDERGLTLTQFFVRQSVVDVATSHVANIVVAAQPVTAGRLPIIFDIEATQAGPLVPNDWPALLVHIQSLRALKNRIFRDSLIDKCLKLFE